VRESPEAARAFEQYYTLGDERSLLQLARTRRVELEKRYQGGTIVVPSEATLLSRFKRWSATHKWQERVISRDRERAEARRKKKDADIEAMNERHAQLGVSLQAKGLKRVDDLLKKEELSGAEAIRMIKQGTDLERVARGEPTERTEQRVNAPGVVAVYLPQKLPIELPKGGDSSVESDL